MPETVLVTGASGFVGAAVVRALLQAGHHVRALLRATSNRENVVGLDVETVLGDLTEPRSLAAACKGCSALFHVAADYRLWVRDSGELYAANVTGTRNILTAAALADVSRVVYTSSVATLGIRADGMPGDEDTPVTLADMVGHYKRSKFVAEQVVRDLVGQYQLPVVIVNPSTPIGPRDVKPTPTGRVIVDAARGRIPAFVDTGLNVAHVDDVAAGHLLAFERGQVGQRYILGGEDRSLRSILHCVAQYVGRRPPSIELPHLMIYPIAWFSELWARVSGGREPMATLDGVRMSKKKMYFSHAKATRDLQYAPRPAEQAVHDALDWFNSKGYCRFHKAD